MHHSFITMNVFISYNYMKYKRKMTNLTGAHKHVNAITCMHTDTKVEKELLSVDDFLSLYPISRSTFNNEVRKGKLKTKKLGTRVFITIAAAREWAMAIPDGNI